ncbi:MAG: hypothetical protein ACLP8S_10195 [Solirubrobacteraceae bacterium]
MGASVGYRSRGEAIVSPLGPAGRSPVPKTSNELGPLVVSQNCCQYARGAVRATA